MRYLVSILSLIVFISGVDAQQSSKRFYLDPYNPEYAPNVVLVKFKDEADLRKSLYKGGPQLTGIASVDRLLEQVEMETMEKVFKGNRKPLPSRFFKDAAGNLHTISPVDKIYKIRYKADLDVRDVVEKFAKDPNVEYAEPDYYVYVMGVPEDAGVSNANSHSPSQTAVTADDPLYQNGDQWYLHAVQAPEAWDSTIGDTTQIIGIIDTGVDWHHPDLDDNIWRNWDEIPNNGMDDDGNGYVDDVRGWDFVNNDNDPMDDNSHGTHVAGIAAAEGNNGVGIAGVTWNARIMPIKVLQSSGRGNTSDLVAGVDYAVQNGATILNMSLGSYAESHTLKLALEYAYTFAVLVAAAGNDKLYLIQEGQPAGNLYPACYSFVLGVRASDQRGNLASFSNIDPSGPIEAINRWGHNYELLAPGVSIVSTVPNSGYRAYNGTSMAAPIVSGAVALMKSYDPNQSNEKIFAKLIQGSNFGQLNIAYSLDFHLSPDLYYQQYTLVDTLPNDDGDGRADAGETVQLYVSVLNAGGTTDSVWAKIRFGEFEDPTTATILKNTSFIGSIDTYGELSGEADPFEIQIASDVINDRDIVFEVLIGCSGSMDTIKVPLILHVENGTELAGVMDSTMVLTADKLWLVLQSFRIGSNGKLIIKPGVTLKIGGGVYIDVKGQVVAKGTADSVITFTSTNGLGAGFFRNVAPVVPDTFIYCHFKYMGNALGKPGGVWEQGVFYVDHCVFEELREAQQVNTITLISGIKELRHSIIRNIIHSPPFKTFPGQVLEKNIFTELVDISWAFDSNLDGVVAKFNNFVNVSHNESWGSNPIYKAVFYITSDNPNFLNNNIINNDRFLASDGWQDIIRIPNQYWGRSTDGYADQIFDFWDLSSLPMCDVSPQLAAPSPEAHGLVWKVEIDGVNPQEQHLDPLGSGTYRFDVYFNRPMDTTYTPFVTFGVREPYTQHIVQDSGHWAADSMVWTGYYTIDMETGDGWQTIRVANARDDEGFEIPIENKRFQFIIQAAGAAATEFIATAGIGKVELAWPHANTPDVLGYNIYRFQNLTDTTFTDTVMINSQLVLDSTYTDYDVLPDTTYHYLYTVVGTDMKESDYSKSVSATPFDASPGDANGDLSVNVLDITSLVAYLLNQNPQPFLVDAADVNSDGQINVLDIVAIVNIVMNGSPMQKPIARQTGDRRLIYSENDLQLQSAQEITALRVVATGKWLSRNNIQPGTLLKSMEYALHVANDTLYLVVYNLKNRGFQEEEGTLLLLKEGALQKIVSADAANSSQQLVDLDIASITELIPEEYELFQNYPNPFNPSTTIRYALPERKDVQIEIYNILGQKIRTFEFKSQPAGYHKVLWDGQNQVNRLVPSGLYIYRIKAGEFVASKKMILIR